MGSRDGSIVGEAVVGGTYVSSLLVSVLTEESS